MATYKLEREGVWKHQKSSVLCVYYTKIMRESNYVAIQQEDKTLTRKELYSPEIKFLFRGRKHLFFVVFSWGRVVSTL